MSTPRQRLEATFDGGTAGENTVCLHSWGYYPFESVGRGELYGQCSGEELADIYEKFWLSFEFDWIHVLGLPFKEKSAAAIARGQAAAGRGHTLSAGSAPSLVPPRTIDDIDRILETRFSFSRERILERGDFEHIRILAERVGDQVMIFPNQGSPGGNIPGLSFEDHMILIQERPDLVEYFVRESCRRFLTRVRVAKECGASGFILSEGYGASCDMISPALYERVFLEAKQEFYSEINRIGLIAVGYFLGDVMPYLRTIQEMGLGGLMVEESKKDFHLDPAAIRKELSADVVLFGNLDSVILLKGTPGRIRDAVLRQAEAMRYGRFVFINGSPICPNTPPENVRVFVDAARRARP